MDENTNTRTTGSRSTARRYHLEIDDLPPALVQATKQHIWELLEGPDIHRSVTADLKVDLYITEQQAAMLGRALDDGNLVFGLRRHEDRA